MTGDQINTGISQSSGTTYIDNCTVTDDGDQMSVGISGWSDEDVQGRISNCTVTMNQGYGIRAIGDVLVSGCTVELTEPESDSQGISCSPSLSENVVVTGCFVKVRGGVGIRSYEDTVEIRYCTIDSVDTGIWGGGFDPYVHHCIVTHHNDTSQGGYGFDGVDAQYCIGYGTGAYEASPDAQGTGSVVQDPLYCGQAGGPESRYSLRVDSYGNPDNNASELPVGAFPVACMYGTLARDATYEGADTLAFLGDQVVPNGSTLTLGPGTTLDVATTDSQSGGSQTGKTELIVESGGSLVIDGDPGDLVRFTSSGSTPSEGDWYGIYIKNGGEGTIEYADIQHAQYGVIYQSAETGSITHSSFGNNELIDIYAGSGHAMDLTIQNNTLTVKSGKGIQFVGDVNGVEVDGNTITGDGTSSAGVYCGLFTTDDTPVVQGNTISGFTNGAAIQNAASCDPTIDDNTLGYSNKWGALVAAGEPILTDNTISYCTTGIEVTGGSPQIGEEGAGNTIDHSYTGILLSSTGVAVVRNNTIESGQPNANGIRVTDGEPLIGTGDTDSDNEITGYSIGINILYDGAPVIRNNQIVENYLGVQAGSGGAPDLGTSTEDGNNTFLDNYSYCISNGNQAAIQAYGNYFGECTGGVPEDCTWGNVVTTDALCEEPAGVVVEIVEAPAEAGGLRVLGARPHPLRGPGEIHFSLDEGRGQVAVEVFDVAGRLVRTFDPFEAVSGENRVRWDATGDDGAPIGSGMYFVRIETDNHLHDTAKLLVVR
jgi:hypothetical protein